MSLAAGKKQNCFLILTRFTWHRTHCAACRASALQSTDWLGQTTLHRQSPLQGSPRGHLGASPRHRARFRSRTGACFAGFRAARACAAVQLRSEGLTNFPTPPCWSPTDLSSLPSQIRLRLRNSLQRHEHCTCHSRVAPRRARIHPPATHATEDSPRCHPDMRVSRDHPKRDPARLAPPLRR